MQAASIAHNNEDQWDDEDFDLPEGHSLIQHLEDSTTIPTLGRGSSSSSSSYHAHKPSRPTYLRMSTGPDPDDDDFLAKVDEDDDEDEAIHTIKASALPLPSPSAFGLLGAPFASGTFTKPSNMSIPSLTPGMTGSITRLGGTGTRVSLSSATSASSVAEEDEDWETDLDLDSRASLSSKQLVKATSRRASLVSDPQGVGDARENWDDAEDEGNVSTIKVAKLSLFPPKTTPATTTSSNSGLQLDVNPSSAVNTPLPPSPLTPAATLPSSSVYSLSTLNTTASTSTNTPATSTQTSPSASFILSSQSTSHSQFFGSASSSKKPLPQQKIQEEDEDMDSAFVDLPDDFSPQSLQQALAHRASKATIASTLSSEWASDYTSATDSFAFTSESDRGGYSHRHGHFRRAGSKRRLGMDGGISASPSTDFTTDDDDRDFGFDEEDEFEEKPVENDEKEEKEVEGLVLPDTFLPRDLQKILDKKKKGLIPASSSKSLSHKPSSGPETLGRSSGKASGSKRSTPPSSTLATAEEEDFESGLIIEDDSELSPSRLVKTKEKGKGRLAGVVNAIGTGISGGIKARLRPKNMSPPHASSSSGSGSSSRPGMSANSSSASTARPGSSSSSLTVPSNSASRARERELRSPSPVPRRSEDSVGSISSKPSTATLRRVSKKASQAMAPSSSAPTGPISQAFVSTSTSISVVPAASGSSSTAAAPGVAPRRTLSRKLTSNNLTLQSAASPPSLSHSYSMLTLPRTYAPMTDSRESSKSPTSPTSASKRAASTVVKQKSQSRLLFSPASSGARMNVQSPTSSSSSTRYQNPALTSNSPNPAGNTSPSHDSLVRLGRKASFSSLVDAETRREREREGMREMRVKESQIAEVVASKSSTLDKGKRTKTGLTTITGSPSSGTSKISTAGAGGSGSRPPSAAGGEMLHEKSTATRTATVGYSAPTASSRARLQSTISNTSAASGSSSRPSSSSGLPSTLNLGEREKRPSLIGLFHPHASAVGLGPGGTPTTLNIPRPTTPSSNPTVLRLTMPTSSTRAKARTKSGTSPHIANVFGDETSFQRDRAGSISPGPGSSPHPRVTSPTFSGGSAGSASGSRIRASLASGSVSAPVSRRTSGRVSGGGTGSISKGLATGMADGARLMRGSKAFGDGTELDGIEDLVVEREKERKFKVNPKPVSPRGAGVPGSRVVSGSSASSEKKSTTSGSSGAGVTGTIGRKASSAMAASSGAHVPKRPPSSAAMRSDAEHASRPSSTTQPSSTLAAPSAAAGGSTLLRRKSRMDFASPSTSSTIRSATLPSLSQSDPGLTTSSASTVVKSATVPLLSPAPSSSAFATMRKKRSSPRAQKVAKFSGPAAQKKPTLIRNLGTSGSVKVVGDMRWNPATLRWEGNDSALKGFESPVHSARPALITQLTGSSALGGLGSPTAGGLASGTRVVGNMIFDPKQMRWINRFEDEEDPFADMSDDDDETDKDVTWGKKRGATIRARSATLGGIPSSGTPLEPVTASPARSAASRTSMRTMASGSASTASESDSESVMLRPPTSGAASSRPSIETSTTAASDIGDDFESSSRYADENDYDRDFENDDHLSASGGITSPNRSTSSRAESARHYRGASTSPVPGVDHNMVFGCREAETRHRQEMKGWFISRRTPHRHLGNVTPRDYDSIRRKIGMAPLGDGDLFDEDFGANEEDEEDEDEEDGVVDRSYLFAIRDLATRKY